MSIQLTVTKTLTNEGWTVVASLNNGATIPRDIFVYENIGTDQLGSFQGTINVSDLTRMQVWLGSPIPVFGNQFVRHDVATIKVGYTEDVDTVISVMKASVQKFSTDFQTGSSNTTVYTLT